MTKLQGIVSSMVTSFTENGELDERGLIENIQFQQRAGIESICILGGTGEATSLTQEERYDVMEITMQHATDLNVIVGALSGSPNEVIADINKAKQLGAKACMVMPPTFIRPSEYDVENYINQLATVGMPLLLFNTPSRSGFAMSPQFIKRLSEIDGVIGIKESSGDLIQLQQIKETVKPSFTILTGGDINYLPSAVLGADGGLLAVGALFPELLLALEQAIEKEQLQFARQLHYFIKSISDVIYKASHPVPLKFAMELRGLRVGNARPPFSNIADAHKAHIVDIINNVLSVLKNQVDFVQPYTI